MYSPKKIVSPRKPPLSPKGAGLKRSLPPKTLANYFKISSKRKGNDGAVTSQEKNKGRYHYLIISYLWRWECYTVLQYMWSCVEKGVEHTYYTPTTGKSYLMHLRHTELHRK